MLSRLVIVFLPRSKCLLLSLLQSPSTVTLEHKKIICHCFHCFPIYLPWRRGSPVLHYLLEFAQIHIHRVSDAVWPSRPLCPLLLLPSVFPSIGVFSSEAVLHIFVAKVLELQLQHQSFQWSDGTGCHDLSFLMLSFKPGLSCLYPVVSDKDVKISLLWLCYMVLDSLFLVVWT